MSIRRVLQPIVCMRSQSPHLKNITPFFFFAKPPLKSGNYPSPLFRWFTHPHPPPQKTFFMHPSPPSWNKIDFSVKSHIKMFHKFFITNPIPSYKSNLILIWNFLVHPHPKKIDFDFAVLCICVSWGAFSHFCYHEITFMNSFIFAYMHSFLFGLSWHNHVKNYRLLLFFRFPRKLSSRLILPP